LKPERPRLSALILEIRRRFAEKQLSAPNYRTVVRRVEALDLRLATAKREGSKKAREMLDPLSVSTMQPVHPMDLLQIDHTPVDVIVVDQQKRLPIGRPWLTLAIDVRTRMVPTVSEFRSPVQSDLAAWLRTSLASPSALCSPCPPAAPRHFHPERNKNSTCRPDPDRWSSLRIAYVFAASL
jgi:putative transposase